MKLQPLAIWVFGAAGSGKSTLLATLPPEFRIIDQDVELERDLTSRGVPLDTRVHDGHQATTFAQLRIEVAEKLWKNVPEWLNQSVPLALETTGNKPPLFRAAVEQCRTAGYRNVGVALRCSLEVCAERNRSRNRILPEAVVEDSWRDFEAFLSDGTYANFIGFDQLIVLDGPVAHDLMTVIANASAPCVVLDQERTPENS